MSRLLYIRWLSRIRFCCLYSDPFLGSCVCWWTVGLHPSTVYIQVCALGTRVGRWVVLVTPIWFFILQSELWGPKLVNGWSVTLICCLYSNLHSGDQSWSMDDRSHSFGDYIIVRALWSGVGRWMVVPHPSFLCFYSNPHYVDHS